MSSSTNNSDEELVMELADDFVSRHQRGESPSISAYCRKHPEMADEIRELFPTLLMLEGSKVHKQSLETPQRIGDYRIISEIGRGGMGIVYEAEQESLNRRVALKVLPNGLAAYGSSKQRFQQEARAAAKMHHTNIVPVFEIGEEGNFVFYAMQLIVGQSLDHVIQELGSRHSGSNRDKLHQLGSNPGTASSSSQGSSVFQDQLTDTGTSSRKRFFRSVAKIGVQVADALAFAHERGVIHRDIKPANLLVDAEGVVWVSDFGLAKLDDEGLTQTGEFVGTLRYMSPERFSGKSDLRTDVYALGLTLYELALQQPAFESADRLKLIQLIHKSDPIRPRLIDPHLPRDFETIILKASEKDPKRRYRSARLLEQDLQRFLNGEPILARRASMIEQTLRWTARNRAIAGSLAAFFGMALITICVLFYSLTATRSALDESNRFAASSLLTQADAALDELHFQSASLLAARSMEVYPSPAAEAKLRSAQASCPVNLRWTSPVFGQVSAMAQSTNGQAIATASVDDEVIWVWNDSLEPVHKLVGHKGTVTAIAIDDSKVLSGSKDQSVRLWDIDSGKIIWSHELASSASHVALDPTGHLACAGGAFRGTVWLWDSRTGKQIRKLQGDGEELRGLCFSRDGDQLAACFSSNEVKIWDLESEQCQTIRSDAELDAIRDLVFLDDGCIAVASNRGVSTLCKNQTGTWQATSLGDHTTFTVNCFATDAKRNELVTGSPDGSIRFWDVDRRQEKSNERIRVADPVKYLAYGPAGTMLVGTERQARRGIDRTVRRVDRISGQSLAWIEGHADSVLQLVFDRKSKTLVSLSDDETIRVWDTKNGNLIRRLAGRHGVIHCVAIDAAGETIFSGSQDRLLRVWKPKLGRDPIHTHRLPGPVQAIAVDPQQNNLVWMTKDRVGFLRLSKDAEPSPIHSELEPEQFDPIRPGETFQPRTLVYSPDGHQIAVGTSSGRVLFWSTKTGELTATISINNGAVIKNVEFNKDGSRMAIQCGENHARILDIVDLQKPKELQRIEHVTLSSICFSPDGELLVTGVYRSEATVWNVASGQPIGKIEGHRGRVDSLRFSNDGRMLASSSNGEIQLWQTKSSERQGVVASKLSNGMLFTIDFSGDEQRLLVKGLSGGKYHAIIIDQETGDHREFPGVFGASLHPNRDQMAVSMKTGSLKIVDLLSDRTTEIEHDGTAMKSVKFNADGSLLAGSQVGTIRVWEMANRKLRHKFFVSGDRASHRINFHPQDPNLLANAGADGTISLWNLSGDSPKCLCRFDGHRGGVTVMRFSRDGTRLISCGKGEEFPNALLWDVSTGRALQRFIGHSDDVWKADISPDGRFVATASRDHTVRLWDTRDGSELRRFQEHSEDVFDVRFSRDGERLYSVSADGTVRIRTLDSGDRLENLSLQRIESKTGMRLDGDGVRPGEKRVQWHVVKNETSAAER